jgi:hypothetical protein
MHPAVIIKTSQSQFSNKHHSSVAETNGVSAQLAKQHMMQLWDTQLSYSSTVRLSMHYTTLTQGDDHHTVPATLITGSRVRVHCCTHSPVAAD